MTELDSSSENAAIHAELGIKKKTSNGEGNKRKKVLLLIAATLGLIIIVPFFTGNKNTTTNLKNNQFQVVEQFGQLDNTIDFIDQQLAEIGQQQQVLSEKLASADLPPPQNVHTTSQKNDKSDNINLALRMNAPIEMSFAPQNSPIPANNDNNPNNTISGLSDDGRNASFANAQASDYSIVQAQKIANPESTVLQGELLQAVLTTAISSELSGQVEASIVRPVYSYIGNRILLPMGSRLIGQFQAGSSDATSTRIYVIWNRVITPGGVSVMISSGTSDQLGRSGQVADHINSHFWQTFSTATLLSLIGASTAITGPQSNALAPSIRDQYRLSIAESFDSSANQALAKNLNLSPTLYVNQGTEINIFVAHDLDLSILEQI